MNERRFWQIIESGLTKARDDQDTYLGEVARKLNRLRPEQIFEFQGLFDQKMADAHSWLLWGAAYLINGGCSDDGFVYFCAWLISQGQKIYSAAIENPNVLATIVDPDRGDYEFEELWGIAREVYEDKVGNEMPATPGEWPGQPYGERWDFDDDEAMKKRLPALAELYN